MLKTVSSITNAIGALNYKGTWDANANSPTIVSSVGTKGDYYVVSVAGSTTIDSESLWGVGDWIVFNGSIWQKIDGGDTGNFTTVTASSLTSGRVTYAGIAGLLQDNAAFTFDGTTLAATKFSGALNGTVGATTPSTGAFTTLSATGTLSGGTSGTGYSFSGSAAAGSLTLDALGNLLVGTTNASGSAGVGSKIVSTSAGFVFAQVTAATTDLAGTAYNYYSTGAGAYRFYVGAGGTIFATSIVITAISDQRLKENVRDIDTGLDAIMALKPRRFDWKEGKGQDKKDVAGFIAQEFEDVFPECVGTSKAGGDGIEYKNINHETLIPTLVKAIQEQQAIITALTTRITALENK